MDDMKDVMNCDEAKDRFGFWLDQLSSTFHFTSQFDHDQAEVAEAVDIDDAIQVFLAENPSCTECRDALSNLAKMRSFKNVLRFKPELWNEKKNAHASQ